MLIKESFGSLDVGIPFTAGIFGDKIVGGIASKLGTSPNKVAVGMIGAGVGCLGISKMLRKDKTIVPQYRPVPQQ